MKCIGIGSTAQVYELSPNTCLKVSKINHAEIFHSLILNHAPCSLFVKTLQINCDEQDQYLCLQKVKYSLEEYCSIHFKFTSMQDENGRFIRSKCIVCPQFFDRIANQLIHGLCLAYHMFKFTHNDLTAANLMMDSLQENANIKLIDFGRSTSMITPYHYDEYEAVKQVTNFLCTFFTCPSSTLFQKLQRIDHEKFVIFYKESQ